MTCYPQWTQAGDHDMRVEVEFNRFVDYVRCAGVWRQQTCPMTDKESVTPAHYWLGDWRDGSAAWPVVDNEMAAWLDKTMGEIR
jgi:hypothetical protein